MLGFALWSSEWSGICHVGMCSFALVKMPEVDEAITVKLLLLAIKACSVHRTASFGMCVTTVCNFLPTKTEKSFQV